MCIDDIIDRLNEFSVEERFIGYCYALHYYLLGIAISSANTDRHIAMAEVLVDLPLHLPNRLENLDETEFWKKADDYKIADIIWIPFGMGIMEDRVRKAYEKKAENNKKQ